MLNACVFSFYSRNALAGYWELEICGRPLGLRFEPSGKLLVADATKGLLRVDVDKSMFHSIYKLKLYLRLRCSSELLNILYFYQRNCRDHPSKIFKD